MSRNIGDIDGFQHRWFKVGECSALEALASRLRLRAGDAFVSKHDRDASLLRDLADEVEKDAKKARAEADEGRDKHYPVVDALDLLDEAVREGALKLDDAPSSLAQRIKDLLAETS